MSYPQVRAEEPLGAGQCSKSMAGEGMLEMNGPSNIEEMSDENKRHHLKKALNVQSNQHEDCWEKPRMEVCGSGWFKEHILTF